MVNGKAQPSLTYNAYLMSLLRHSTWLSKQGLEEFAREVIETGGLGIVDWLEPNIQELRGLGTT